MKRRQFLQLALSTTGILLLSACGSSSELKKLDDAPIPEERSVNFGFEDVSNLDYDWAGAADKLKTVGANAVGLGVGRVEWVAHPWPAYTDSQALDDTADPVKTAMTTLGDSYRYSLIIDTLVPSKIAEDPSLAGVSPTGERSTNFASVTALRDGEVGDRIIELAEYLADRYNPQRIVLTELMFDDFTFGEDDLESYKKYSGAADWPRTGTTIDTADPSLGKWRSEALRHLAEKIQDQLPESTQLELDVRAPWDDPTSDRALSGHDYDALLSRADRIGVWNYHVMNDKPARYSQELATSLSDRYGDRYTISVGLWGDNGTTVSPADMALALRYAAQGGADHVSVTPASKMTDEHWTTLGEIWVGQ
ncbi:MAG: hypothetical protein Q4D85_10895 [Corynebacterium sp.]|uniref:hypothetical protein n=1 Tax=Corynebacterium sp. TaxID=1720 RepID=UPI0026DC165F|nr:hypothetical protein [Corynebacterium sp.]MDO5099244.1 hypothetical protein [Corynebacterium sp.]